MDFPESPFLFPAPAWALLDAIRGRKENGALRLGAAMISLMLDLDSGNERSARWYANQWGWGRNTVAKRLPIMRQEVDKWRSFYLSENTEPRRSHPRSHVEATKSPSIGLRQEKESHDEATPGATLKPHLIQIQKEEEDKSVPLLSWQIDFARAFAHRLQARKIRNGISDKELDQWADAFDKLSRIDGHSQETIREVCTWLFDEDDFWIGSAIRSPLKFRRKNKDREKYFDVILSLMAQEPKQRKRGVTRASVQSAGDRAREILAGDGFFSD